MNAEFYLPKFSNTSPMHSILLSPESLYMVSNLHRQIANNVSRLFENLANTKMPDVSLETILLSPELTCYSSFFDCRDMVRDWSGNPEDEKEQLQFNRFGTYDMVAIKSLLSCARAVKDLGAMARQERPSIRNLVTASRIVHDPAPLLAIKYFYLFLDYGDNFQGINPYTTPVKEYVKAVWGLHFEDSFAATLFENRLAGELGIPAFLVNSLLWIKGKNWTPEAPDPFIKSGFFMGRKI